MPSCELSPSASAFSAMVSAFVGSVINGLTSGWLVAFMTGWITLFALFRVLLGALYMLYRTVTGTLAPEYDAVEQAGEDDGVPMTGPDTDSHEPIQGYSGSENPSSYGWSPYNSTAYGAQQPQVVLTRRPGFWAHLWPSPSDVRAFKERALKRPTSRDPWGPLNHDVTILGWLGWTWTALYAPISQLLWVAANVSSRSSAAAKIVKGLSVAVTALPLCIDTRVRYGEALAGSSRPWMKTAFNLVNGLSCLLQGVLCAVLLVLGAKDVHIGLSSSSALISVVYSFFATVWMIASLRLLPIRDGGRRRAAQNHWYGYFADVGMGVFAGIFVAAPAFALWQSASFSEQYYDYASGSWKHGSSSGAGGLEEYLSCETQVWRKFAAIFP